MPKLSIKLDFDNIEAICEICNKYRNKFDVDVKYGRYTVDGCSILGVASLGGKRVEVKPITDDPDLFYAFYEEICEWDSFKIDKGDE